MIYLKKNDKRTPLPSLSINDALVLKPALGEGYVLVEVTEREIGRESATASAISALEQILPTFDAKAAKPVAATAPSTAPTTTTTTSRPLTDNVVACVLDIVTRSGKRGADAAKFRKALPAATHGQIRYARELLVREGAIQIRGTRGNARYFLVAKS